MEQQEKIDFIAQDLPMILEIKDKSLAEKVADVWLQTLKSSCWDGIAQIPFKDDCPERTLKEHVNACAEASLALSRIFHKHHGLEVDEDRLLAFALIHDVDKAIKYTKGDNGQIVISEAGAKIQHGVISAMIARDCGFSLDMIHLLITHTPSQNMKPAYAEGVLFAGIDLCDWELVYRYCRKKA